MQQRQKCPECGGRNLHESKPTAANGGYGPEFLPGLGKFFSGPKVTIVLCEECGLMRFFAEKEALSNLRDSAKWKKL